MTIYINARSITFDEPTIGFAEVVERWMGFDPARRDDLSNVPGVDWKTEGGTAGTLYPSDEPIAAVDGLSFTVDVLLPA